jgi:hypothetical protein
MTYEGHVQNGAVVLDEPAKLPEGAEVEVAVCELSGSTPDEKPLPTLYERLESVIGIAEGLRPDFAENHDYYPRGRPKK